MVDDRVGERATVSWHKLDRGPYGSALSLALMMSLGDVQP
jgi:hypothetical protein